jgi:hypothetical protein
MGFYICLAQSWSSSSRVGPPQPGPYGRAGKRKTSIADGPLHKARRHRPSSSNERGRWLGQGTTPPGKKPPREEAHRTSHRGRRHTVRCKNHGSTVGQPGHGIKASQKGAIAESPTPRPGPGRPPRALRGPYRGLRGPPGGLRDLRQTNATKT